MTKNYLYIFFIILLSSSVYQAASQQLPPSAYAPSVQVNYIRSWLATAPETDPNALMTRPLKDVKQTTMYADGLGRPIQSVVKKGSLETASNTFADLVTPIVYDGFGRESVKYLSFASTATDATKTDGNLKLNPIQQQVSFYNIQLSGQAGETNTGPNALNWAYSLTAFETSPLNRKVESFSPGVSWVGTAADPNIRNHHSVKLNYWFNTATDDVKIWTVTDVANSLGSYAVAGTYAPGTLTKNVMTDERNNQVEEFKDYTGNLILRKVALTATDDGSGSNYSGWLCTYYIYDDLNILRCVIQPEGVKTLSDPSVSWNTHYNGDILLREQCFRYEYDGRGRMIIQKIPGAEPSYMVYDSRDRVVMTQDGNLRDASKKQWLYTQYDELDRPVATGLLTDAANYNNPAYHWNNAYGSAAYPNLANYTTDELTRTFYNDYTWLGTYGNPVGASYTATYNSYLQSSSNSAWPYPQANAQSSLLKGMVTGSRNKVLGTSTYIYVATFYDDKSRVIQTQTKNKDGGLDVVTNQYAWAGQTLVNVEARQKSSSNPTIIVLTQFSFDDLGRVVKTEKKIAHPQINGGAVPAAFTIASEISYDALGQAKSRNLGRQKDINGNYTNTPIETLSCTYNIRGWLLNVNRDFLSSGTAFSTNYFGMELSYDKDGVVSNASKQYNNNVGQSAWRSRGDNEQRKYDYSYDAVNRLLRADFTQLTGATAADVNFNVKMGDGIDPATAYDANGNIKRLQQWGLIVNSSAQIDDLRYSYLSNSNKLNSVTDLFGQPTTTLGDFKTASTHPQSRPKAALNANSTQAQFDAIKDYGYDPNGNLVKDDNKAINLIAYNHLGLASSITVQDKGTIAYTYDAAGNKLQKQTAETNATVHYNNVDYTGITVITITDYVGCFLYESKSYPTNRSLNTALGYTDKLQFASYDDGRIRALYNNASNSNQLTGFAYDYMIKDHLGDVRMLLTDEVKADAYPQLNFEGTSGSAAVGAQNMYWEDRNTQSINVENVRTVVNMNTGQTNAMLTRRSTGSIGATKFLKVMAGDRIHTSVDYYYTARNTNNNAADPLTSVVNGLIGALSGSSVATGMIHQQSNFITSQLNSDAAFGSLMNAAAATDAGGQQAPKAYLCILFFNEQMQFDSRASVVVPVAYQPGTRGTIDKRLANAVTAGKNGYAYIYFTNESDELVYWDNFTLTHERSPILEETHYYPFGLVMSGISSRALTFGGPENRNKYNGKEEQRKEFSDGSGLDWMDYGARMYDNQIARWNSIDPHAYFYQNMTPYNYVMNNPLSYTDPNGMDYYFDYDGNYLGSDKNGNTLRLTQRADYQAAHHAAKKAAREQKLRGHAKKDAINASMHQTLTRVDENNNSLSREITVGNEEADGVPNGANTIDHLYDMSNAPDGNEYGVMLYLNTQTATIVSSPVERGRPMGPAGSFEFGFVGLVGNQYKLLGNIHGHPDQVVHRNLGGPGDSQPDRDMATSKSIAVYSLERAHAGDAQAAIYSNYPSSQTTMYTGVRDMRSLKLDAIWQRIRKKDR